MAARMSKGPWVASIPIVVSDRDAAKRWYTERLGMMLLSDDDHWVTVGREGRGSALHLCQGSENQPTPVPLEPGPSGIVLTIPGEFEPECAKLEKAGVEFLVRPTRAPWGWYATIRDPDGNEFHLAPAA